jgi:hypothetical protein
VKCDEAKPGCRRCQKFGRACDGYPEPSSGRPPAPPKRRLGVVPIQPRLPPGSLHGPAISIHSTEQECRYFQVFVAVAARELPGYLTTDFWSRVVCQESHTITAIRYAAIAVGALNRSLENAPGPYLKVNIIQSVDRKHHEYAVLYYLKAVQTLNQYLSTSKSPQMRVALISCLLFVCFETFQGSFVSTARQSYGGLKILRSYCAENPRSGSLASQTALPQSRSLKYESPHASSTLHTKGGNTSKEGDIAMRIKELPGTENNLGLYSKGVAAPQYNTPHGGGVSTPVPYSQPDSTGSGRSSSVSTAQKQLSSGDSQSPTQPILQNDLIVEESLVQMFTRLNSSGEFFGLTPFIPPMVWDIHKVHHLPVPDTFPDYTSAQRSWDFLMDNAIRLYRRTLYNRVFAPGNSDPPAKIAKQYAFHVQQLSVFERAFQPILNRSTDCDGTLSNPAALVLSLYQKCTLVILAAVQDPSEMVYDCYLPEFQYITSTCARLIRSQDDARMPPNRRFAFEAGLVPPLHFTATKCRDPIIRREAIELLFSSPRQEGMWDSLLCTRIGTWLISCEEDGLPPPPLGPQQPHLYVTPGEAEVPDSADPPTAGDETEPSGGWEDGRRLSEVIKLIIGDHFTDVPDEAEAMGSVPHASEARERRPVFLKGWRVPEKNRVRLSGIEFNIPDRYIKIKCRKTLLREDGSREENETVISW